jgi:hypothetical protein
MGVSEEEDSEVGGHPGVYFYRCLFGSWCVLSRCSGLRRTFSYGRSFTRCLLRARWLGVVVAGSAIAASAHAQGRQVGTEPPSLIVTSWVGPTSARRDTIADSVGKALKQRFQPTVLVVRTRAQGLDGGLTHVAPAGGYDRPDLLEIGKAVNADFIVDLDIDDDRSGPQLTTLIIERETNAERRFERIPLNDLALAVRTLVERIATDSIMTQRRPVFCSGTVVYFEFQVDRQAELIRSSINLPRSAYGEGEVLAQFVVDTMGVVRAGTFKSLKATHGGMVREVLDDLPNWRFTPASTRRCGFVSQLVQMPVQR